jgi:curved DNA-binding protein CbpA
MKNYYNILGLSKTAPNEEIKKAYKNLAMQYHPDKNKDPDAIDKFKDVSEAYQILSDPHKRNEYDHMTQFNKPYHVQSQRWQQRDPFDIFNEMFSIMNQLHKHIIPFNLMQNSVVQVHIIDLNNFNRNPIKKTVNVEEVKEIKEEPQIKVPLLEDTNNFKNVKMQSGNLNVLNDSELDTIITNTIQTNKI